MSVQGKNSLSYKKKNVQESNTPYTGFKNITFAHEFAAAGESFIPFSSLAIPGRWIESGLVNPDASSLLNAQLQAFRPNVTVTSSAKGLIQKEEYIVYGNRIEFKDFVSEVNEVFEVEVSDIMISGNLIVDMQTIRVEGNLVDAETDFNMGYEFDVNDEEIIVFRDGLQMFRSDNNESSGTTGNYYYLDTGNGKASVIRFFEVSVGPEAILIASTGGRVDNPNTSTFQEIDKLQGQIDAMVPSLASLAGVPETDFQSSPNRVDLKYFGDKVVNNEKDNIENKADIAALQADKVDKYSVKYKVKPMSGNVSSNQTDIVSMKYINLTIGRRYRVSMQFFCQMPNSTFRTCTLQAIHNGLPILRLAAGAASTPNAVEFASGTSRIFTATNTTVTFSSTFTNAGVIFGDGTTNTTFSMLEDVTDIAEETTDWD